ncbi:hypothetical protein GCM10010298_57200 [Streptomyces microflavus]|uniref:Uncharacterized protein n=1 Tax=Streptomyces microflavus TaxID=1919 RepID=A0A7J0CQA2_STRMI|nr:hypothetical protein Smic_30640 [Streptomyces microflavus]GGX84407.1 hypothetical protein GCM10010298_57200 [Streptomyces microflavus]
MFSGPYAFDGVGQALDGARHGLVGEVPVAEDEGGGICLGRGQAVVVQARQAYVRPRRLLHHRARRAVRQGQEQVESGGRPADGLSGQPGREFAQEVVAAAFVAQAGGPQMAVVRAGGDEAGEGVLVDDGRRGASGVPRGEGVGPPFGSGDPAQPYGRGEGLAQRTEQGDMVRRGPLQVAHGMAVVAELGVVVVLHDQAVHLPCPVGEFGAAGGGEDDAGGELVGRGHDHGPGGSGLMQEVDAQAVLVHGYRDGGQPCGGHGEVELRPAGVLDRHVGVPGGP